MTQRAPRVLPREPWRYGLLAAVLACAVLTRAASIWAGIGFHTAAALEPASDSQIHADLVRSLLAGHGFSFAGGPTAITPPLYVFVLAGIYGVFSDPAVVRVVQIGLGAADCLLLYEIGRHAFDETTALLGAALLSVYPLAVYLAGLHLTENLFLFLLLLTLVQAQRVARRPTAASAALFGGLVGLGMLTRSAFVGFLPFLLVWAVCVWGPRSPRAYRTFAVAAFAAVVVVAPWTIRNSLVLGAFVPVQDNGGLMFWAGNNATSKGEIVWPSPETWTATRPPDERMTYGWRGLSIAETNRRYVRTALSWIRTHPRQYAALLAKKLERLYGFSRAGGRTGEAVPPMVGAGYALFLASALGGIVLSFRRWRELSLLLALVVFTNVITLLFSGGTRYSVPMVPSLILFSACAAVTAARYVVRVPAAARPAVSH